MCKSKIFFKVFAIFIAICFASSISQVDVYAQMETPAARAELSTAAAAVPEIEVKPPLPKPGNVTVNFKEVDIKTVLHYLSEISGVDIVPSPGVDGTITMRLRDKPWEVALDIVTRNYGFAYSREGDIIRVIPKGKLQMEEPITEVVPLNYIIQDTAEAGKDQNITQLMDAINSVLVEKAGEKATFVPSANAVVITAIPARVSTIRNMVSRIDKKTPQIMLEARVIEITLDRNDQFGIDWNAVVTAAGARRPTTVPFANDGALAMLPSEQRRYYPGTASSATTLTGLSSFPFVYPWATASMINPASFTTVTNTANLFSYGTLDFTQFTATLRLIDEWDDTNILSSPRITTLNNQTAIIKVITKLFLQKQQKASDTATTVTVEFEKDAREVGVTLEVTPHVNDRGEISVNLKPEVSSNITFNTLEVAGNQETQALQYNTRSADTQVMVRDGETIFIGGLITETIDKEDHKFPILGDLLGGIPLVGSVFKYEQDNIDKTEVVIFVTVHLIKDGPYSIEASKTIEQYKKNFPEKAESLEARKKAKVKPPLIKTGALKVTEHEVPIAATAKQEKAHKPFLDFRKKK